MAKTIVIDLWKAYKAPIEVVQREAGARTLSIQLTEGGAALNLTGKTVTLYATKPDGSELFNACTVTSAATGKVTYLMTAQTCAVYGTLACTIVVTGASYEARSQPFVIEVIASPDYTTSVESSDEYTALAALSGSVAASAAALAGVVGLVYPIGCIYQSVVSTSPATLFGGTWAALGAGKVLVGIDATDATMDTAEETGGSKDENLDLITAGFGFATPFANYGDRLVVAKVGKTQAMLDSGNLQPYLVVYRWKRTA